MRSKIVSVFSGNIWTTRRPIIECVLNRLWSYKCKYQSFSRFCKYKSGSSRSDRIKKKRSCIQYDTTISCSVIEHKSRS